MSKYIFIKGLMVTFFDTFSSLNYGTYNLSEQGRLRG